MQLLGNTQDNQEGSYGQIVEPAGYMVIGGFQRLFSVHCFRLDKIIFTDTAYYERARKRAAIRYAIGTTIKEKKVPINSPPTITKPIS